MRAGRFSAVIGAMMVAATACSGATASTAGPKATGSTTPLPPVVIQVSDNEYTPGEVRARVDQVVTWQSGGGNPHDIKPSDAAATWGVTYETLGRAGSYSTSFAAPGRYPYYCTIHGTKNGKGMAGVVVVDA